MVLSRSELTVKRVKHESQACYCPGPFLLVLDRYALLYSSFCSIFFNCVSSNSTTWSTRPPRPNGLTVAYNLPLLFMATNRALFTPKRLTTPRSTVEISSRPDKERGPHYPRFVQSRVGRRSRGDATRTSKPVPCS